MIIVTGTTRAKEGHFDALRQASIDHVHRSRAEDGCISHSVQVDCEDPMTLVFFERWRDLAALRRHFEQPGTQRFVAAMKELAAGAGTLDIYEATLAPR